MSTLGLKTRPTRYELLKLKDQYELAQRAHDLLENKYRMLNLKMQSIREDLQPLEKQLKSEFEKSHDAFLKALMNSGLKDIELASKSTNPNDHIEIKWERVYGLTLPTIEAKFEKRNPLERGYDLSMTSAVVDEVADHAEETLSLLVKVSELKNIIRSVKKEVERTKVRVFALEKVLIPQLDLEIKKIEIKLEQRERDRHTIWNLITSPE